MAQKLFVCEFLQESNSFNPLPAGLADFSSSGIFEGDALLEANGAAGPTLNGMITEARRHGLSLVGGIRMRAGSGGPVEQRVADEFLQKNLALLRAALPVDGVLVSLHGATQSETVEDLCGDVLEKIRAVVGEKAIISASCDLHANVTARMLRNADFVCGYQTYPHLDHYGVGERAAKLAAMALSGKRLYTACVSIPMMAPAHGYTTGSGALGALMERGHALVAKGRIADFSVFQVQPWLDVADIASTVLVTAADRETAMATASEFARAEFDLRKELQGEALFSVADVVKKALVNREDKPIVLVDSADSPNAGACGDSAAVLEEILPYRDTLRTAVSLIDAAAVEKAFALGVGAVANFTLGATIAPKLSRPVTVENATVKSLHSGDFILGGPAERGVHRSLGRCAVLTAGEVMILVTERGQNNGDLQFYRGFGIEPTFCRLVCVKACTSFRAGYAPLSAEICNTATPGAAGVVLTDLPFARLPKPFYPFEEITADSISAPVCYR